MLDYGGYNGFLPYALNQKHKISSFVADLDKKGLNMANFLGSKTIDLSKNKIEEKNFLIYREKPKYLTTYSDGYLGSRNDEERSEMRYVMRIAEYSESSNF